MTTDKKVELLERMIRHLVQVIAGLDPRSQYDSDMHKLTELLALLDADAENAGR